MNKSRKKSQIFSTALLKKLIIFISVVIFLLFTYWVLVPFTLQIIYSRDIPDLPNLSGYNSTITKYIEKIYSETLDKPYSDEAVGKLAMVYHSNFFYEHAVLCYNAAKKLNNEAWLWHYYIALIKEELGDTKPTIENLQSVVEINPRVVYAWFRLGNSYLKQNSFKAAESAFKKVINSEEFTYGRKLPDKRAFPLIAYARLNLGRVYFLQEKYELANLELVKLIQEYPRFGPAYRLLGQLFKKVDNIDQGNEMTLRAGDFESYVPPSDPMFNELILNSRNTDFILKQIGVALKSDNFAWAEYLCRYILHYDPDDIEAIEKYILLMLVKNKFEGLDKKLDRYFDFYFDNDEKLIDMAETLYRWNQQKIALKFLERAITVNPNAINAHMLYLKILVNTKFDDNVIKHCEKVLKLDPNNSELRTEYGRILALQGKEKEAKQQFELALKIDPKNEVTLILLGIISQEKGDINTALNYYRRSVKVNPLNVKTILKLGNYLLELKKWNEALDLFEESIIDSPNNVELLERYAWIQATCPDPQIRNGEKSLELGKRISLIRKASPNQDIQSGITLAAANAEMGDFANAIKIMTNMKARAKQTRLDNFIPKIDYMIKLFKSKRPYRLTD